MKKIALILFSVFALSPAAAHAQSDPTKLSGVLQGYQVCKGDQYALCAASTCTPTGNMITVNVSGGGTAQFPEASCTCPVLNEPAIADIFGGNMQGSCATPGKGKVWSLYWPNARIPQAINNWSRKPANSAAPILLCGSNEGVGSSFANCFSFACIVNKKPTNGVKTATCLCPLGENLDGSMVAPSTPVVTQAGQCNKNGDICTQHPVAGPYTNGGPTSMCLSNFP